MYSKELEELISSVLADGVITAKEREVLHRRAEAEGFDPDELDVMIDGRLVTEQKDQNSADITIKNNKWKDEPTDYPRVSELLEALQHIRRSTSDPALCLLRMKSAIARFPIPKSQNDIMQFLTLCIPFTKKKSKKLFANKKEKLDTDLHNSLLSSWKDKCTEVILEARLEHLDDEQTLQALDEHATNLGI